jgi:hypothetical protein
MLGILSALLTGCSMNDYAGNSLNRKNLNVVSTAHFPHCYGYDCKNRTDIDFSKSDWAKIERLFRAKNKTPQAEREDIAQAIALFEQQAGAQSGTYVDRGGTFEEMFNTDYQHDCVDESLNTTIYLQLLQKRGLLTHHTPENPAIRLPLVDSGTWPHQSAVISEIYSGDLYAVDSWFHDNGAPAEIIPMQKWKDGWKP